MHRLAAINRNVRRLNAYRAGNEESRGGRGRACNVADNSYSGKFSPFDE